VAHEEVGDPAESRREREFDYDRTVALSDGVFAIALTLLILNVHQPNNSGSFWDRVGDVAPDVYAYALSFAVIGLLWLRHHAFFRDLRRIDGRIAFLNLVYLGLIAFIPFPTSLLADHGDQAFSVVAYALTLSLASLANALIRHHAARERLITGVSATESAARVLSVAIVFGISIPIAFISPTAAELTWIVLFFVGRIQERPLARGPRSSRSGRARRR
jgi:uncharacterized membrane protein